MANFGSYNSTQSYQGTQYFPQPQGNVYMLNNSLEISNVPMGASISVGLCPSEELMYLKSMQNGVPMLCVYKISPYEPPTAQDSSQALTKLMAKLEQLEEQIENLKNTKTEKKGGSISELI